MENIVLGLALASALSAAAFATPAKPTGAAFNGVDEVCGERIAKLGLKDAKKRYGTTTAETISIRSVDAIEALNGEMSLLRAFKVQVSDEVDASTRLVITDDEDCLIELSKPAVEE